MWKAIHSVSDIDIDVFVNCGLLVEAASGDKVFEEVSELEAHVFVVQQRSVEL